MKTRPIIAVTLLIILVVSACSSLPQTQAPDTNTVPQASESSPLPTDPAPVSQNEPTSQTQPQPSVMPTPTAADFTIEVVAQDMDIPWEIAFLPDGDLLITERSGSLLRLGKDKTSITIDGVAHIGEGGLLGLALHPDFEQNNTLYLYLTSQVNGIITNRVERYILNGDRLDNRNVIIEGIPGAANHDGGRIEFGPDGYLYITTGDAGDPQSAQDIQSLAGKILRLTPEGAIPEDNPFQSPVYSYGHRNPQGITWDDQGRLWSTEHGRSGFGSGFDELNLIEPGKNYGWPVIQGDETREGMQTPVIHSGASTTWAPGDVAFARGTLYFSGLRGASLYAYAPAEQLPDSYMAYFEKEYGRLRAVRLGPDGHLYITTSNQDGRGRPFEGDDKLLRINLDWLQNHVSPAD